MRPWSRRVLAGVVAVAVVAGAVAAGVRVDKAGSTGGSARYEALRKRPVKLAGIHKIKHVIVIMQENRSFDSYFGTYPGADGIPANVCVPDPANGGCVRPLHDPNDLNRGGPHGAPNAVADVDGGRMDGFVAQAERGRRRRGVATDVMGYHDEREIPNYWAYARNFVLQDRMFEPNASWSLPEHLFMVSERSALCPQAGHPLSHR